MSRKLRLEYPGAIHHVINRGDCREDNHYGSDPVETGQEKAGRLIAQELKRLGWKEDDLRRRRKGDPEKVKLARRLRAETTMTLAWVASRHNPVLKPLYRRLLARGKAKKLALTVLMRKLIVLANFILKDSNFSLAT